MYAIVVAKDEGLARALLLSLDGIVSGISVIGEVEALRRSSHCDAFFPLLLEPGPKAAEQLAAIANRIADDHRDTVIVPADVPSCRRVIAARGLLRCATFPAPEEPQLEACNDKWQFYNTCVLHEIQTPKTVFIGNKADASYSRLKDALSLPFLIKPTCERDGAGVVLIGSDDDYRRVILDNTAYRYAPLIGQQYIPGEDVDISLLAFDGLTVCSAVQVRRGSLVRFIECEPLRDAASLLVERIGYTGPLHLDARKHRDTGSIWLIEANPRIWGTINAARWCGLNFIAAGMELACSKQSSEPEFLKDGYYPGLASALTETLFGRSGNTKIGRERRRFVSHLMFDPYEYYRLWDRVKSLSKREAEKRF